MAYPHLSSLSHLGFRIIGALQNGGINSVSLGKVSAALREGTLNHVLDAQFPGHHFFVHPEDHPDTLALLRILNLQIDEQTGEDGLLALLACIMEAVQQKWYRDYHE